MKITDLNREELTILSTNYPEEMMKVAREVVVQENAEDDELLKTAQSCYDYGAELAESKILELEAMHQEKVAAKHEEKEGKKGRFAGMSKKDKDEDEEEESAEKNAHAMGNFILEGYWDTLMEKGAEFYQDEHIYLEELVKEAGFDAIVSRLQGN